MESRRPERIERTPEKRLSDLELFMPDRKDWARLNECAVGEKPFATEFYEQSPLLNGLHKSAEISIVLPSDIGDAVLTAPLMLALQEWAKLNALDRRITVASKQPALFEALFPRPDVGVGAATQAYVINARPSLEPETLPDPRRGLLINETSWVVSDTSAFALPQRVMRSMELLLGQKLFNDVATVEQWLGKPPAFEEQKTELANKYQLRADERVLTISAGASVMPKEYAPEKWRIVLEAVLSQQPELHVLFLEDPSAERRARYSPLLEALSAQHPEWKISRVSEGLSYMHTIMELSDLFVGPDTGLGHLAGAHGVPNVLLYLSNPEFWRTPKTVAVNHPIAGQLIRSGELRYKQAWDAKITDGYYVMDGDQKIGASDIDSEKIMTAIESQLNS